MSSENAEFAEGVMFVSLCIHVPLALAWLSVFAIVSSDSASRCLEKRAESYLAVVDGRRKAFSARYLMKPVLAFGVWLGCRLYIFWDVSNESDKVVAFLVVAEYALFLCVGFCQRVFVCYVLGGESASGFLATLRSYYDLCILALCYAIVTPIVIAQRQSIDRTDIRFMWLIGSYMVVSFLVILSMSSRLASSVASANNATRMVQRPMKMWNLAEVGNVVIKIAFGGLFLRVALQVVEWLTLHDATAAISDNEGAEYFMSVGLVVIAEFFVWGSVLFLVLQDYWLPFASTKLFLVLLGSPIDRIRCQDDGVHFFHPGGRPPLCGCLPWSRGE